MPPASLPLLLLAFYDNTTWHCEQPAAKSNGCGNVHAAKRLVNVHSAVTQPLMISLYNPLFRVKFENEKGSEPKECKPASVG